MSLWSKEQVCLLSTMTKIVSSFQSQGQACIWPIIEDLGSLSLGFLTCNTAWLSSHDPVGTGAWNQCKCWYTMGVSDMLFFFSNTEILFLLPEPTKPWQANLLACKYGKTYLCYPNFCFEFFPKTQLNLCPSISWENRCLHNKSPFYLGLNGLLLL